jgi:hypothetical protein
LFLFIGLIIAGISWLVYHNIPILIPKAPVEVVANRALAASGVKIDIRRIAFYPQTFQIHAEGIYVTRTVGESGVQTVQPLGSVRLVEIVLNDPWKVIRREGDPIRRVLVDGVSRLLVIIDEEGRFRVEGWTKPQRSPGAELKRLSGQPDADLDGGGGTTTTVPSREPRRQVGFDFSRLPVSEIRLSNFTVLFQNAQSTGPLALLPRYAQIQNVRIRDTAPGLALASARLEVLPPGTDELGRPLVNPERLDLRVLSRDGQSLRWGLNWSGRYRAALNEKTEVLFDQLLGEGAIRLAEDDIRLRAQLRSPSFQVITEEAVIGDANLQLQLAIQRTTQAIQLDELVFDSDQITAFARGTLPQGEFPKGRLEVRRAGGPLLSALASVLSDDVSVRWSAEDLFLRLEGHGAIPHRPELPDVSGLLSWSSVTLGLQRPVQEELDLSGEMRFDTLQAEVPFARVITTDGLSLGAQVTLPNPIFLRRSREMSGEIRVQADTTTVLERLRAHSTAVAGLLDRHEISGTGPIRLDVSFGQDLLPLDLKAFDLRAYLTSLERPRLEGRLRLSPVQMRIPTLEGPVEFGLETSATERRVELSRLEVSLNNQSIRLRGGLDWDAESFVEQKPLSEALGRLALGLDFNNDGVGPFLPPNLARLKSDWGVGYRGRLEVGHPRLGQLITERGLPDLRLFIAEGRFLLPDFLPTGNRIPITGLELDTALRGRVLTVNRLRLPLSRNGAITATAEWAPGRIRATAGGNGDLEDIKRLVPRVFNPFDVFRGRFSTEGITVEIAGLSPAAGGRDVLDYWTRAFRQVGTGVVNAWNQGRLSLDGVVRVADGALRHNVFAPARDLGRGRRIGAAAFSSINGSLRFQRTGRNPVTITALDGFRVTPTNSPASNLNARIVLRQTDLPELDFGLVVPGILDLDPWIFGWGTSAESRQAARRPAAITGKRLNVRLAVEAQGSRFQAHEAGPLRGNIAFQFIQRPGTVRTLEIQDLRITDGRTRRGQRRPGRIEADAILEFREGNLPDWPRWRAEADIDPPFSLATLIQWVGTPTDMSRNTLIGGRVNASGQSFRPGAIDARGRVTLSGLSSTENPILGALIDQTRLIGADDTFSGEEPFPFRVQNGVLEFNDLSLTQGYVRLNGKGSYRFAERNGAIVPNPDLDSIFQIEAIGTVFRQVPLISRIPLLRRIVQQGDQVISRLVLQFRVTGDLTKPVVSADVGRGLLNPIDTVGMAGDNIQRELRRGVDRAPGLLTRIINWILDRLTPPSLIERRREIQPFRVLTDTVINPQLQERSNESGSHANSGTSSAPPPGN